MEKLRKKPVIAFVALFAALYVIIYVIPRVTGALRFSYIAEYDFQALHTGLQLLLYLFRQVRAFHKKQQVLLGLGKKNLRGVRKGLVHSLRQSPVGCPWLSGPAHF